MTGVVFAAAALSALLHAWWNILARRHPAPGEALGGIAIATASLCALVFPFVGPPPVQSWPWIGAASVCNVLYLRKLGMAYAQADFCIVYAIVRAIVPAMLFASGWLILNEQARPGALAGLTIIAVSILIFAVPRESFRRLDLTTLAHSICAGGLLALALLSDVQGIRAGGQDISGLIRYTVASSLVTAAGVATMMLMNKAYPLGILTRNGRECYLGAVLLLGSYLCGMWAYAQGPIGLVAPVRESGIIFGGLLAVAVLRQCVTEIQWMAMLLSTLGIVLIQAG